MGGHHETQDATGHTRSDDTSAHDTPATKSDARACDTWASDAFPNHTCTRRSDPGSASGPSAKAGINAPHPRAARQNPAVILNAAIGGFATMAE